MTKRRKCKLCSISILCNWKTQLIKINFCREILNGIFPPNLQFLSIFHLIPKYFSSIELITRGEYQCAAPNHFPNAEKFYYQNTLVNAGKNSVKFDSLCHMHLVAGVVVIVYTDQVLLADAVCNQTHKKRAIIPKSTGRLIDMTELSHKTTEKDQATKEKAR